MNIFNKIVSVAVSLSLLVACSTSHDESANSQPLPVEVGFELSGAATRTTIGDDGETTRWVEGDKLSLWAKDASGNYAVQSATFALRYFSTEYDKAYFAATIAAMAEGEYTYYLSYPSPKAVEGTKATYSLSASQSGKYEGGHDIMIAEPVVAEALTSAKRVELNTVMRHQMHAIKITIPEKESNFASKIHSIEVTFPCDVVGDMTLDVADLNAEPVYTNTSNTITVKSDEGFEVGSDIWVFVLPGTVSGDVSYKITGFEQRSEVATYPFERELQAGHVTPIRMAMPPFEKYTAFHFSIGQNYLGEDFNFFTLYDNNGTNMGTYQRNAENRYTFEYNGEFDVTPYNNSNWTLVFDSESAVVENKVNMGELKPYFSNNIAPVDSPHLLFENFENVSESESYGNNSYSSDEREQPGKSLDGAMPTNGWNAARYWLKPGAMRINARRQCVKVIISFTSSHHGRMDTPLLWDGSRGIKPGKSVNVKLQFDAAMNRHTSSSLAITEAGIAVATHTNASNPIDGIPTGTKGLGSSYSTTLADFGTTWFEQPLAETAGADDFGKTFPTYSTDFTVSSDSRICFYPTLKCNDGGIANTEINVYIDNIKVSIAK
ncbi:MAG: hypothetical protein J6U69_00995 [Alistipes sp.]|nr:hypothetical protein [Alistipes sp.]